MQQTKLKGLTSQELDEFATSDACQIPCVLRRPCDGDSSNATAGAARRIGPQPAEFSAGYERNRRARCLGPGAQCPRPEYPATDQRLMSRANFGGPDTESGR